MNIAPPGSRVLAALGRWSPWVVGSALSLLLFWVDFTHSSGGKLDGKAFWGRDFVNLWAGGHLLRDGRADAIYDVAAYREYLAGLFGPMGGHNYSYPPVTFPIARAVQPAALLAGAGRCGWARPARCSSGRRGAGGPSTGPRCGWRC